MYRAVGFCENRLEDLRARQATRDVLPFLLPSALASFPTSTEPAACKPLGKPVLHAAGGTCLQTGLQWQVWVCRLAHTVPLQPTHPLKYIGGPKANSQKKTLGRMGPHGQDCGCPLLNRTCPSGCPLVIGPNMGQLCFISCFFISCFTKQNKERKKEQNRLVFCHMASMRRPHSSPLLGSGSELGSNLHGRARLLATGVGNWTQGP